MKSLRHWRATTMAALFVACLAGNSTADVLFDVDVGINGDLPVKVNNSLPALTALFQNDGANQVKLTLDASNLLPQEFVGVFLFNYDGDASSLTMFPFPPAVSSITKTATQSLSGGNQVKAGLFNIQIDFNTSSSSDRFQGGETLVFSIQKAGIDEADFSVLSIPKPAPNPSTGGWYAAADIQGIPDGTATTSGSVGAHPNSAVPEPASLVLFILGGAGLFAVRLRRGKP